MSAPHVDADVAADGIKWFSGWGPKEMAGPCEHRCDHTWGTRVIAWGWEQEHYELIVCDDPATCNGYCRGWTAEWMDGKHPRYRTHGWKTAAERP